MHGANRIPKNAEAFSITSSKPAQLKVLVDGQWIVIGDLRAIIERGNSPMPPTGADR